MACTSSRSALALVRQANLRWPGRARGADGTCPSPAHHLKNPNSWHEPNAAGVSRAVDLTKDLAVGCDTVAIGEALRVAKDKRVHRCIAGRRQWTRTWSGIIPPFTWRPYFGTAHTGHMHLDLAVLDDDSPWPGVQEVDDMRLDCVWILVSGSTANLGTVEKLADAAGLWADDLAPFTMWVHARAGSKAENFIAKLNSFAAFKGQITTMPTYVGSFNHIKKR